MFSLLLAIIISASLAWSSLADPSLESSLSFGVGGIGSHQTYSSPSYGYGTSYYSHGTPWYNPEQSYYNNHLGGYSQNTYSYVPGRMNPYLPYRRSISSLNPSYSDRMYISSPNQDQYQQSSLYKSEGNFITPSPQKNTYRYPRMPYFESVGTYLIYRSPKKSNSNSSQNTSLDSDFYIKSQTTDKLPLENTELIPSPSVEDETTNKKERDLQLKYLGYMPSAFSSDLQDPYKRSSGSSKLGIPFYPLGIDSETFNSQRSASPPTPILFSPYRLRDLRQTQIFNKQQTMFNTKTLVRPVMTQPTKSLNQFLSPTKTQLSGARPISTPIVSPFIHNNLGKETQKLYSFLPEFPKPFRSSRTPFQNMQNGYYLFDVQPLSDHPGGDDQPSSVLGLENSKSTTGSGYMKQKSASAKSTRQHYNPGFETILPHGPTYPNLFVDRGFNHQENVNTDRDFFVPGRQLIINPYGPEEMRLLVGRLLTLRRASMLYPTYKM